MGNYPLPALDIKTPQMPDATETIGRIMQLKSMMGQQQLQQQQLQGAQLENQQRQMDVDSQKALQKAYMDAGGDVDKTSELAAKYGAKPTALLEWQKMATQMKLTTLDLVSKQGDLAKVHADLMQGAHDAVANAPSQDRPAVYQQQLQQLQQRGVDVSQVPPQYPGDEQFKYIGVALKSHSQMVEDALKSAEVSKNTAQTREANATAQQKEQETAMGGSPAMADAKYRFLQTKLAQKQPIAPEDQAWMKGYEKQKLLVPATTAQIRVEGMGQNREYPVLDTKNGNSLQYISAADLNKANQEAPGRYVPAVEGNKALGKTALIEDIRGNIQNVRGSLSNPKMPEFTAEQRAQIALALGGQNAPGAIQAAFRGGVLGSLSPEQQDYLINMAQLKENAMAMRSVLGAGQGSEDMRSAITATIPGPNTPSKAFAQKQLDKFEQVLNRLERGVPNVPLRNTGAQNGQQGGTVMMKAPNGQTRPVPADQVEHFKSLGATVVSQ